ncbi:MAG TPA: prenyltransferase/squalene oxidase repeat-containing protein, partial [Pirellulales bacterium]|nr:prenyltransferase/squalene oxidase repeat-containing protein [Pirellulales bacterium]
MSQFLQSIDAFTLPAPREVLRRMKQWVLGRGPWWLASMAGHMLLLIILGLLLGRITVGQPLSAIPVFDSVVDETPPVNELTPFELDAAPLEPSVLDPNDLLTMDPPGGDESEVDAPEPGELGPGDANGTGDMRGILGDFDRIAVENGPAVKGSPGTRARNGDGTNGFQHRRGRGPGTKPTKAEELAVKASLSWLARHQNRDGSWSLHDYARQCKDQSCTGLAASHSDTAATALGLLPFLAAGVTHKSDGPYKKTVNGGLAFLLRQQAENGNLAGGAFTMYAHGLATIAISEAYGLSKDAHIGKAAQAAVRFIEAAQHHSTGGWRYNPGEEGDTSVVGWQVMALKSAQMAGLQVNTSALAGAKKFLKSAASGASGGLFAYTPGAPPTPTMSAVGLLCSQYLGTKRESPLMKEGVEYLMRNLPARGNTSVYYWYYATQVLHNLPGPQWDEWNRTTRKVLIESQVKQGCAAGSWDPERPYPDPWGPAGGRLLMTSLNCL